MDDGQRKVIATQAAPSAIGPYSQGVVAAGLVFTAGQIGLNPATGQIVSGGTAAETRQALENVAAILAAAGSSLSRVTKTTVFMVDLGEFGAMNEVYASFFPEKAPARSAVQVVALPKGARVEIEAFAQV